MSESSTTTIKPGGDSNVTIEELYPRKSGNDDKPLIVTIRVAQNKTLTAHHREAENGKKHRVISRQGSKLVQRNPNSSMKLDQLNKHEQKSFIQDTEANEAILKNTVSKEELCRFLSPLKFLEIQTWRKEVPFGDTIDEAEVEHRRWRTPIEILLPTVGRDDDGNDSFYDGMNSSSKEDSSAKRKSTSTNSKKRKFFDDVRKQNAEMLQRSPTDNMKVDATKSHLRATTVDHKVAPAQSNENRLGASRNETDTTEGRLRTAYAPANPIPPYKDGRTQHKKSGQIYVNHELSLAATINDGIVASSFSPGKPVLSRIRNINKRDGSGTQPASMESKPRPVTSGDVYNPMSVSEVKGHRIQSSSWPGGKHGNAARNIANGFHDDVQVLPLTTSRPQTVGNDLTVGNQYQFNQRHNKFRGPSKPRGRGWRHWDNRRVGIETTFNAATRLYQNSVLPKRAQPIRTFVRANRSASNARETPLRNRQYSQPHLPTASPIHIPEDNAVPRRSARTTRKRVTANDHVTKISYALNRPNEIKVQTLQGPKQRETMSRVTPIPPIEMILSRNENVPLTETLYAEAADNGGIKYISANGVIELNHVPTRKSNTPWVAEAFKPSVGAHEDYYSRQQRQNKTVTFRLGAT